MNTMHLSNSSSRYLVGIDLGTTNSAVAYFDTQGSSQAVNIFRIPQMGKQGHEESYPLLPSFLYLAEKGEIHVGAIAKSEGAKTPTKLVHSAKSWLSNPAANRRDKILPFDHENVQERLTPVEASAHYLAHIKNMWDRQFAKGNPELALEEQEIVLTIPASFDEVARALTVEAAHLAGLRQITLLEEPQAAFYCWLMDNGRDQFQPGDTVLVCDVGGGTTDFTLIDMVHTPTGIEMRRMAVGKHLLLGGDNMDAAICHALASRLDTSLERTQHLSLLYQARTAKEKLLTDTPSKIPYSIVLTGQGSKVVAGSHALEITYDEIEKLLVEGFFGLYPFEEANQLKKGSGIRQMGLGYEAEPSITKHLASFLYKNKRKERPTYVLFNGGAMKPPLFQKRIIESLHNWFPGNQEVKILSTQSLDLSVARGAAYFNKLRKQEGGWITGGIPRTFYLEIELQEKKKALVLIPRGTTEGSHLVSPQFFSLVPNQPVSFQLYYSQTRLNDQIGDLIEIDEEELTPLPPIQTLCKYGKKEQKEPLPVQLEMDLTLVGTLELWLHAKKSEHKWKLEFQLRHETSQRRATEETFEIALLEKAQQEIQQAFAIGMQAKLPSLMATLETILEKDRRLWPLSVLRSLFQTLIAQNDKRLLSSQYASRFWNLAGFFLRPGIGYPLDDHRIKQLWHLHLEDLKKTDSEEVKLQKWICFRRIAAGFSKGQQRQLFNELSQCKLKKKGYSYAEHLRALASLELAEVPLKIKLGNDLIKKITEGKGEPCDYWALGRIGARQLFYGSAANVIPRGVCETWIKNLLQTTKAAHPQLSFTFAMLARKTDCPEIDLSAQLQEQLAPLLAENQALILHERDLSHEEQERFFGDSLPPGLQLHHSIDTHNF
jgi:molecular chaperone DnaK (HSP70)